MHVYHKHPSRGRLLNIVIEERKGSLRLDYYIQGFDFKGFLWCLFQCFNSQVLVVNVMTLQKNLHCKYVMRDYCGSGLVFVGLCHIC